MAPLGDSEIEQRLRELSDWRRAGGTGEEAPRIERDFRFPDFAAAISFVDQVAERAEAADHHPDILVHGWNKVRLTLSTHSQGGLTDADFALAREIDALA
jgi:4a-hydroxytetrahydrobiopterin dehydratase